MNIIKFKDQIRPGDDLFNTYLKGKYAYWLHMRYVVPFEFIDQAKYIALEHDITPLLEDHSPDRIHYWDIFKKNSDINMYIDIEGTDSANNLIPFTCANNFATDSDITLEEVKLFRAWLADTLLEFDRDSKGRQKCSFYSEPFTAVLEYYRNNMYDDVVKRLSEIRTEFGISMPNISSCGCNGSGDLSALYAAAGSVCVPLDLYRKHIYNEMVKKFSDLDFWADFPSIFLIEFKAYIDNIIRLNLELKPSPYKSQFVDCSCISTDNQITYMEILKRLSKSLEYIYDDQIKGHRNFIASALMDWSSQLYESMQWA